MAKHEGSSYSSPSGLSCTVYASLNPVVDTAAVFVHGFNGEQERTWRDFQTMIDEDERFASWDAYFVGYPSTREQIGATAYKLTRLINEIFPQAPSQIFERRVDYASVEVQIRRSMSQYSRLVLIGHSQGGAVIRKAVLEESKDALRDGTVEESPICGADLALFAPALFGMFLSGWKGFMSATSAWKLIGPALSASPSFKELQPGSQFLVRLENETHTLAQDNPGKVAAISARIVWATRDKVVQGGLRYSCDPACKFIEGTHTSVCKPDADFPKPLLFVRGEEVD
jgi:hypothetical protein